MCVRGGVLGQQAALALETTQVRAGELALCMSRRMSAHVRVFTDTCAHTRLHAPTAQHTSHQPTRCTPPHPVHFCVPTPPVSVGGGGRPRRLPTPGYAATAAQPSGVPLGSTRVRCPSGPRAGGAQPAVPAGCPRVLPAAAAAAGGSGRGRRRRAVGRWGGGALGATLRARRGRPQVCAPMHTVCTPARTHARMNSCSRSRPRARYLPPPLTNTCTSHPPIHTRTPTLFLACTPIHPPIFSRPPAHP